MTIKPNGSLNCPCGERNLELVLSYDSPPRVEASFYIGDGKPYQRSYAKCTLCQHYFGQHEIDLSSLYEGSYVDATYGSEDGIHQNFERIVSLPEDKSDNKKRVTWVNNQYLTFFTSFKASERPTVLDVGAGLGVFPYEMKKLGWDVLALDPDPRAKNHMETIIGVNSVAGDFMTVSLSELGKFDLITFNKVMEHVPFPFQMLQKAIAIVKPGGGIYVEVPDIAAASDPDGKEREEFTIDHLHVFSAASAILLGERAGLFVVAFDRIREPSGKYTLRILFKV